jgi:hypothetical protein
VSECEFSGLRAVQCDFSGSILHKSEFKLADLVGCYFQNSSIEEGCFEGSVLDVSSFSNTNASLCVFLGCSVCRTDFTNANLTLSVLIQTDFSGALLTGVKLYGAARTDWCIEGVECQYVFWDQEGKERFPPDNDFEEGEFSTQYRPYTMFSYICTEEELLEQFGVSTPVFFSMLEEAKVIPADTLRYVHHHYKQLIGSMADPFSELIDHPATEALTERL